MEKRDTFAAPWGTPGCVILFCNRRNVLLLATNLLRPVRKETSEPNVASALTRVLGSMTRGNVEFTMAMCERAI